jgi:hypothetical protein
MATVAVVAFIVEQTMFITEGTSTLLMFVTLHVGIFPFILSTTLHGQSLVPMILQWEHDPQ